MKVAVAGCCHGELDRLYESVLRIQDRFGIQLDLLIVCGDLQTVRDEKDLDCVNCPPQHRELKDFHKYYSGEKQAPVTTVFIGGHQEASNYLRELYYGGWVAPRMYYLGCAGVVRVGPLRIAGLSGVFWNGDYCRGHHECPPYNEVTRRSSCHVREWEVACLERLAEPVDIVVSHDWPRGIWKHGNCEALLQNPSLQAETRREIEANTLGSPAAMELLKRLPPAFWFSAHLHAKFAALVPHTDGTFTRFLALDRCAPRRHFLQVLDVDPTSPSFLRCLPASALPGMKRSREEERVPSSIGFDPEWLAIQKVNHTQLPLEWENQKAITMAPTKEDVAWVVRRLRQQVGAVPRDREASMRHQSLLPTKLRRAGGQEGHMLRELSTTQLRELFETRGLDFPGHLDKASLVRQLEEHDEVFAAERKAEGLAAGEAFPIPERFAAEPGNGFAQRTAFLELLELEDVWRRQEDYRRALGRDHEDYDPFAEAPPVQAEVVGTGEQAGNSANADAEDPGDVDMDKDEASSADDEDAVVIEASDQVLPDIAKSGSIAMEQADEPVVKNAETLEVPDVEPAEGVSAEPAQPAEPAALVADADLDGESDDEALASALAAAAGADAVDELAAADEAVPAAHRDVEVPTTTLGSRQLRLEGMQAELLSELAALQAELEAADAMEAEEADDDEVIARHEREQLAELQLRLGRAIAGGSDAE